MIVLNEDKSLLGKGKIECMEGCKQTTTEPAPKWQ